MKQETAIQIATKVAKAGGRAYYVGGFVRDMLLGRSSDDVDMEVYGLPGETLWHLLEPLDVIDETGTGYGIFKLKKNGIDVALPRTEIKIGCGHRDFAVQADPMLSPKTALARRDFTVNAMLMDVLTGEIIDPFGGREDLQNGILRHVGEGFSEDPLRVLRGCQFAARFEYSFAEDTAALCGKMDLSALSGQRVAAEMSKALLQAKRPSLFFVRLRELQQLSPWFSELEALIGLPQNPVFHPEGDVWNHTMQCLDRTAEKRSKSRQPYRLMLLALTHDFGKVLTTEETDGVLHAYGHETQGTAPAVQFLSRLKADKETVRYMENMIPLHMKPNRLAESGARRKSFFHLFDDAVSPEDLILFSYGDKGTEKSQEILWRQYMDYQKWMAMPYVDGTALLEAGLLPGTVFKEALAYAHKLRLSGTDREEALKQTLAYAKSIEKRKEKKRDEILEKST